MSIPVSHVSYVSSQIIRTMVYIGIHRTWYTSLHHVRDGVCSISACPSAVLTTNLRFYKGHIQVHVVCLGGSWTEGMYQEMPAWFYLLLFYPVGLSTICPLYMLYSSLVPLFYNPLFEDHPCL